MNEHAILRLQREARVELEHTVRPFDCPIVAARQDLATQTRAFEGSSDDGKGDALAVRDGTDVLGGGRSQTKREERLKWHGGLPIAWRRLGRLKRNVSAADNRGQCGQLEQVAASMIHGGRLVRAARRWCRWDLRRVGRHSTRRAIDSQSCTLDEQSRSAVSSESNRRKDRHARRARVLR